jgi:hypothetical protein
MTQDYGKQIMLALRAVEQLHSDCSKLLVDFDKKMAGWNSVFSNYATRDLTYRRASGPLDGRGRLSVLLS